MTLSPTHARLSLFFNDTIKVQFVPLHLVTSSMYRSKGFVMNDDDDDCEGTDPTPILAPLVTSLESRLKVILLVASPADDSNDVTGGSNVYSKPLFSADVVTLLSNLRLDKIESKALSPAVICFVTSDVKRLKTLACSVELTKVVFLMVAVVAVFITVSSFDKSV